MKDYTEQDDYLERVLKYLPKHMKAEICSTGGGYESIIIPFDQHTLEISDEGGGLSLYSEGAYILTISQETNPRKLAKTATDIYRMNFAEQGDN